MVQFHRRRRLNMGEIIFAIGLVMFVVGFIGWIINLIKMITISNMYESIKANQRMLIFNIVLCCGALVVNIGTLVAKLT